MTGGRATAVGLVAVLVLLGTALPGQAAHDDGETRIAIIDSGIRESHEAFADGQVVAWKDFRGNAPSPEDDTGHGTAVASMAAGLNIGPQTPSHAPGTPLIVAKRGWGFDLDAEIQWAVDQGADILTLSFYAYQPQPPLTNVHEGFTDEWNTFFDALETAVDHGVFVTVLAGNGLSGSCGPTASWLHPPATSPDVLVVGGANEYNHPDNPRILCSSSSSTEPEVTAPFSVRAADNQCDTCYETLHGTSFSTPLVAGIGARVIDEARDQGISSPPTLVEEAVKFAAEDTPAPPTVEGYGFLGGNAANRAQNELPDPEPDGPAERANQAYVENVQETLRETWYNTHRGCSAPPPTTSPPMPPTSTGTRGAQACATGPFGR